METFFNSMQFGQLIIFVAIVIACVISKVIEKQKAKKSLKLNECKDFLEFAQSRKKQGIYYLFTVNGITTDQYIKIFENKILELKK